MARILQDILTHPGTAEIVERHRIIALYVMGFIVLLGSTTSGLLFWEVTRNPGLALLRYGVSVLISLAALILTRARSSSSEARWVFMVGVVSNMLVMRAISAPTIAAQYLNVPTVTALGALLFGLRGGLGVGVGLLASFVSIDLVHAQSNLLPIHIKVDTTAVFVINAALALTAIGLLSRLLKNLIDEGRRSNSRLEQILEDYKRLFAIMAHDVGNLLFLARLNLQKEDSAAASHALDRLVDLVADVGKIQAGAPDSAGSDETITVGSVTRAIEFFSKSDAERKQIHMDISSRLDPSTIIPVSGSILVHVILMNFVRNAIKFNPLAGRIMVHADEDSTGFRFEIRDKGPGIPESVLRNVAAGRASLSTSGTGGEIGTGLGLLNACEMARRLDCKVEFLSNETGGTLVRVIVPKQS